MVECMCDVPEFKRCCFCIPTKLGLLAWGFLKLYVLSSLLVNLYTHADLTIPFILGIDAFFTILLIAAVLMKKDKLLRIYYIWCLAELVCVICVVIGIYAGWIFQIFDIPDNVNVMIFNFIFVFDFLIHGYIALLVRSEIMMMRTASYQVSDNVELPAEPKDVKSGEEV